MCRSLANADSDFKCSRGPNIPCLIPSRSRLFFSREVATLRRKNDRKVIRNSRSKRNPKNDVTILLSHFPN